MKSSIKEILTKKLENNNKNDIISAITFKLKKSVNLSQNWLKARCLSFEDVLTIKEIIINTLRANCHF